MKNLSRARFVVAMQKSTLVNISDTTKMGNYFIKCRFTVWIVAPTFPGIQETLALTDTKLSNFV